jgi:MYXO-CTERM domain-containing protein
MLAAALAVVAVVSAQTPGHDNNVWWGGLAHDSAQPTYRPDGEKASRADGVTLRVRSFQFDLTALFLEWWDGAQWHAVPAWFDADLPPDRDPPHGCQGVGFPCVIWVAAIPPDVDAVAYRFRAEDGTDTDWVGAAAAGTGHQVYDDAPDVAQSFQLASPGTGKRVHVRTGGGNQSLAWALAPCGTPGSFSSVTLGPDFGGWRSVDLPATPGVRVAFRVTTDGVVRETDRLGRPWTSTHDEVWLDQGLTYDVDPGSVVRRLVDSHTHPITGVPSGFSAEPLTTVLDRNAVALGLTSLFGYDDDIRGLVAARPYLFRGLVWARPTANAAARASDLDNVTVRLRDQGFLGIKLHPTSDGFPADAPFVDPYMELAAAYRVPVVIHTGPPFGSPVDDNATTTRVANLALRHPGVLVVMYHMDIAVCDRAPAIAQAQRSPNILVETSWSNARQSRMAMCSLGAHRVMFGTDAVTDGDIHYSKNAVLDANCQGYVSYLHVLSEMRGTSPYAALGDQELRAFERDTAITAFELSQRPFVPGPREACVLPPAALVEVPFPHPQSACTDFPGGPVDGGALRVDGAVTWDAAPPRDAALPVDAAPRPDAATARDAAIPPDAARPDAALARDAAVPADGSAPGDAASPRDAAPGLDRAPPPDAGVVTVDGSAPRDAATAVDAALPPDAAPRLDAAIPPDAAPLVDAAVPPDAAVVADAGAQPDGARRQDAGRTTCIPGCHSETERLLCPSGGGNPVILPCATGTVCRGGACVTAEDQEEPDSQTCACAATTSGDVEPAWLLALLLLAGWVRLRRR